MTIITFNFIFALRFEVDLKLKLTKGNNPLQSILIHFETESLN